MHDTGFILVVTVLFIGTVCVDDLLLLIERAAAAIARFLKN